MGRQCSRCNALVPGTADTFCPNCRQPFGDVSIQSTDQPGAVLGGMAAGPAAGSPATTSGPKGDPVLSLIFLAMSIAMAVVAIHLFQSMTAWEETGGRRQMPWLGVILYKAAGKWSIVGIAAFWSAFFLYGALGVRLGWRGFRAVRKDQAGGQG